MSDKESNIVDIFPADDFKVVADEAKMSIEVGLIIGYDNKGDLFVFGGGLLDGRRPVAKDWLWMIKAFEASLLRGDYAD